MQHLGAEVLIELRYLRHSCRLVGVDVYRCSSLFARVGHQLSQADIRDIIHRLNYSIDFVNLHPISLLVGEVSHRFSHIYASFLVTSNTLNLRE